MDLQPTPPALDASAAPRVGPPPLPAVPGAVTIDPSAEEAPVDAADITPHLGFWQQPWVQNVLPFVTSLSVHAAIIIMGLLAFGVYKAVTVKPHEEQVIIPEASMAVEGPPGGVPNVGVGGDPLRQAMQDKDPNAGAPEGFAEKKGPSMDLTNVGGGSGDTTSDASIQLGPGGGFGRGAGGLGTGQGDSHGAGSGDGSGAMARFGAPGGGGIGPKGPVFGDGGNARTIAFLCDSTGSMFSKMPQLKFELSKAVSTLRVIQSFSVIFFHEPSYQAFDGGVLLPASPENKRKADKWLGDVIASGPTNPLPALEAALKQKPQLLYFLTDAADFPDNKAVLEMIHKYNKDKRIRINTILFVENADEKTKNKESEDLMRQIAEETGGRFRWVQMDLLTQ